MHKGACAFLVIDSKREIKGIIDTIGMRLSII